MQRLQDGSTGPSVSAGISRLKRCIGSYTLVPACSSALIKTSGVRLRWSPAVLDGNIRNLTECVTVTVQSVTCHP